MDIFHNLLVCVSFYTFMTMIFFFIPQNTGENIFKKKKKKKGVMKTLEEFFQEKNPYLRAPPYLGNLMVKR